MTDYQETLDDRWNEVARQVQAINKRLDAQSAKISKIKEQIDAINADIVKRRSSEF